jgi:hypothetical protein
MSHHNPDNKECPWNDPETFMNPATAGLDCTCKGFLGRLEIESYVVSKDEYNYELLIIRPDGSKLKVLIPVEGKMTHCERCIESANGESAFGLNFVCEDHYT